MYGSEPPSKENQWQGSPEFRPTAVRGILRYWFRAVALGLYDAATCQALEEEIFGKLSQQGQISISVLFNADNKKVNPYLYSGRICLEAAEEKYLNLVSRLLILASHLGGVGRGSRRPLHLLNQRMRGCHWEVIGGDLPFEYDTGKWKQFFQDLRDGFKAVRSPVGSCISHPGAPSQRQQDVLDKNAQVWLYQVVTIFGTDHGDRLAFAQALQKLGADLVFGQMPSDNRPQPPQPRRR